MGQTSIHSSSTPHRAETLLSGALLTSVPRVPWMSEALYNIWLPLHLSPSK